MPLATKISKDKNIQKKLNFSVFRVCGNLPCRVFITAYNKIKKAEVTQTSAFYYYYTVSKKVSGLLGLNTSLQVITVIKSCVSDRFIIL